MDARLCPCAYTHTHDAYLHACGWDVADAEVPGASPWEEMMDKEIPNTLKYTSWRRTLPVLHLQRASNEEYSRKLGTHACIPIQASLEQLSARIVFVGPHAHCLSSPLGLVGVGRLCLVLTSRPGVKLAEMCRCTRPSGHGWSFLSLAIQYDGIDDGPWRAFLLSALVHASFLFLLDLTVNGKTEYKSVTYSPDTTAEEYIDLFFDDDYRPNWNPELKSYLSVGSNRNRGVRVRGSQNIMEFLRSRPVDQHPANSNWMEEGSLWVGTAEHNCEQIAK
eukprot:1146502-Pelagomonas_calceolata.AAC.2